jgi:hypothetical protein
MTSNSEAACHIRAIANGTDRAPAGMSSQFRPRRPALSSRSPARRTRDHDFPDLGISEAVSAGSSPSAPAGREHLNGVPGGQLDGYLVSERHPS